MSHIDKHLNADILKTLGQHIKTALKEEVLSVSVAFGELTVTARKSDVLEVLKFLRDDKICQFKMLLDVTAVDEMEEEERFRVVYHLLSLSHNLRVRLKIPLKETVSLPSCIDLFSSAGWYEREVYDMFGIVFEGHPDLRRILTDYGFEGHPLRKDFPVEGEVEVYYDTNQRRVAYKPVDLPQDFRPFETHNPWAATTHNAHLSDGEKFNAGEFASKEKKRA